MIASDITPGDTLTDFRGQDHTVTAIRDGYMRGYLTIKCERGYSVEAKATAPIERATWMYHGTIL